MSIATIAAAAAAAADLLARGQALFADIKNLDVETLIKDAEADVAGIGKDLAPLKAEAITVMEGVNAKLSSIGTVLHAAGLASAGPNVESSDPMGETNSAGGAG